MYERGTKRLDMCMEMVGKEYGKYEKGTKMV